MTQHELQQIARALAEGMSLDPALVQAVCETESSWNPWAVRFEPGFYRRYVEKISGLSETEKQMRSTSFGLMQVMGQVAREQGYAPKYLTALCDPLDGIQQGCKKLKACLDKTADVRSALLRYNGGADPGYPDRVLANYDKYKEG